MPPRSRNAAAKRAADPFPDTLSPQLATLVSKPPARGDWVYEIKLDGYRILARCEVGKARLFTRNKVTRSSDFRCEAIRSIQGDCIRSETTRK